MVISFLLKAAQNGHFLVVEALVDSGATELNFLLLKQFEYRKQDVKIFYFKLMINKVKIMDLSEF